MPHARAAGRKRRATHGAWLTGVDAITMDTSDGGKWSWSCSKECPDAEATCAVRVQPIGNKRNFTQVIGPLPSALAMLTCMSRITDM